MFLACDEGSFVFRNEDLGYSSFLVSSEGWMENEMVEIAMGEEKYEWDGLKGLP